MHKCVVNPDFAAEHVLSRDPWLYVELLLQRSNAPEAAQSLPFWRQARKFAEASEEISASAAPLVLYYAFLNATKALLTFKKMSIGSNHGVAGDRPEFARATLSNEIIKFKQGGVLPDLCRFYGESTAAHEYSLKDILWNIPYIHRAFRLTYTSATDLFIPLEKARYVKRSGSNEAWFQAEVITRFADKRKLVNIPPSFEYHSDGSSHIVRRKKRFRWCNTRASSTEKTGALKRLSVYHSKTRRVIVNISGNRDLWYLKRHQEKNPVGQRHTQVLTFAAMHRLSELARYDPAGLERHLAGQANWLLREFISMSLDQFIDQVASEITGCQFWPAKTRMSRI